MNIKCLFGFLYNFYLKDFLILRRTHRVIVLKVKMSSCEVPVIPVRF